MRLSTGAHLSYCTNVHAGASWDDAFAALAAHAPRARDAVTRRDASAPFGLGLRVSHEHLVALERAPTLASFRDWLDAEGLYVFTLNGFPYGDFHGRVVKEAVYRPDWSEAARLDYTRRLATLGARLAPPDSRLTLSTVPGAFRARGLGAEPGIAANLLAAAAHCARLADETGVSVGLALEPEPGCLLETVDELVAFFAAHLHAEAALARFAADAGLRGGAARARARLDEHLGACHDACHSAVEFESPLGALERLRAGGVPLMKLQLSSALILDPSDADALRHLARFDEPVYLHQVVAREASGALRRHVDLAEAFAARRGDDVEWRVHFHVPVFMESLARFATTRDALAAVLDAQRAGAPCPHLEVETYTWDVLPERYRDVPLHAAIARELDWTLERLGVPVGGARATGSTGPGGSGDAARAA